ncbi:M23 family metallopeptidase [Pseudomonas sp. SG20056]|uniref:M23 family metallopeptidase n=1 Tax=Pseudomonas sp. SG20056 TaxID=3074146 RepID=UPI00287F9851|nr:M23 family metallopeptidase [Pseudomonas sp. SG20056]WNF47204.1 M23 family metallopeptidase [Pseudomonas sp. SG20056]
MKGRTCIASNFVIFSCLGLGAINNTGVIASEINHPAFNYSAQEIQRLLPASGDVLFSNELFLYGRDAEAFDLAGYLAVHAPLLRDKQELIAHWSGYYSINPKVVLALMELKSGLMSAPSQEKLQAPFAELSKASGFTGQLRDVLQQLSQRFYGFEAYQRRQVRAGTQRSSEDAGALNGASAALLGGLQDANSEPVVLKKTPSLQAFTQQFAQLFSTPPEQLRNAESSREMALAANALPPTNMLQLPWYQGYSWKSNGAHSHTGSGSPYSSIDVSYDWPGWGASTYSVAAAHGGRVSVLSRCQVRVTNDNGWATNYYHMDNIRVSNGETITANTKLGNYASNRNTALCEGGSSTGPHLHFSLLYNGRYVSLQGVNLGAMRISVGAYNYDDQCNRFNFYNLNTQRYQCAWSALYNAGPLN